MNIKLAWRNIWRNKRRTLITIASIAFAVFFSAITRSLQLGTYASMIENSVSFYTGYAQVHKAGYWDEKTLDNSFELTDDISEAVKSNPEVINAVARIESFALVSFKDKTKASMVLGIDPDQENLLTGLKSKVKEGKYLTSRDQSLIIGEGLADYLNVSLGDSLAMISQGYHGVNAVGKYVISGIFDSPLAEFSNGTVYMPIPLAQEFFGSEGLISSLSINAAPNTNVNKLKHHMISNVDQEKYEVMTWQEMMPELVQNIELDQSSGKIILYVLYLIIGFGMFGTVLMMAKERTYEYGILMAIGMRRIRLQILSVIELIILSLGGVLTGIVISFPIIIYMFYHPIPLTGDYAKVYEDFGIEPLLSFSASPIVFIEQAITVLIIALILGIYPLWFISRLKVAASIRD